MDVHDWLLLEKNLFQSSCPSPDAGINIPVYSYLVRSRSMALTAPLEPGSVGEV